MSAESLYMKTYEQYKVLKATEYEKTLLDDAIDLDPEYKEKLLGELTDTLPEAWQAKEVLEGEANEIHTRISDNSQIIENIRLNFKALDADGQKAQKEKVEELRVELANDRRLLKDIDVRRDALGDEADSMWFGSNGDEIRAALINDFGSTDESASYKAGLVVEGYETSKISAQQAAENIMSYTPDINLEDALNIHLDDLLLKKQELVKSAMEQRVHFDMDKSWGFGFNNLIAAVSYTHLTLPTIYSV